MEIGGNMQYVALLRGVNISGKNKIAMKELKGALEGRGYEKVVTHLNSGNVIFEKDTEEKAALIQDMQAIIKMQFGLEIPVFVTTATELADILAHAPIWWGTDDKEIYDNLIFLLPPTGFEEVYAAVGAPKEGIEQVENYGNCIFWSFALNEYRKSTWWSKTASTEIKDKITIRTANTMRKVLSLCRG